MQTATDAAKIIVGLMKGWGLAEKDQHSAKQQGEQYAGKDWNSNFLPFSAVCDPTGKTGRCRKQIYREYLKNRLQHGVIINEGIKINFELWNAGCRRRITASITQ
jgi:hypothetical protein